jgi:hypothetical protein
MEVHSHTHTYPDSHRDLRKKWTHYLWEFLMLFLAVFCGFLAENLREHKVEKQRAKQYIISFYNDLASDTAEFSLVMEEFTASLRALENSEACYNAIKEDQNSSDCLEDLFKHTDGFTDLISSDQTLQQLKNAGNFRLLDHEDTDSILLYDKMIRAYVKEETTSMQESQYNLRNMIYTVRNYEWTLPQGKKARPSILFQDNKELLNKYFNSLNAYAGRRGSLIRQLITLNKKANGLIRYFKTKYHLH